MTTGIETNTGDAAGTPDRLFRRNFIAGLVHGIFFQMSAAFGSLQTVLPSFVALLTPATAVVGAMSTLQGVGEVLPQLFTAHLIRNSQHKKRYLLMVITIRWISWALLAWLTYRYALSRPWLVLTALPVLFGVFSIAGGAGGVVYADIFARVIPANRRGRFVGSRQLGGFALAIASGGIVKHILDRPETFPFPLNYSVIFVLSAAALAVAFIGFALIVEPAYPPAGSRRTLRQVLAQVVVIPTGSANFRRYLVARAIIGLVVGMTPYFMVNAQVSLEIDPAAAGLFLGAQMAGAAASNILWGWIGDAYGNKPVIVGSTLSAIAATAAALLVTAETSQYYAAVFFQAGAMMSGMRLGFSNFLLEMAPQEDRATCVAVQNTILLPIAMLPFLMGLLLQASSFRFIFALLMAALLIGLAAALKLVDPRQAAGGTCEKGLGGA